MSLRGHVTSFFNFYLTSIHLLASLNVVLKLDHHLHVQCWNFSTVFISQITPTFYSTKLLQSAICQGNSTLSVTFVYCVETTKQLNILSSRSLSIL